LADSEGDENSISEFKRMMIRMFKKLKEDIQNNSTNPKKIQIQKLWKTQKQLNELKENTKH
jgi:hypothetical protein